MYQSTQHLTFSGEYLMKIGLQAFSDFRESSRVIEITAQ